MGERFLNYSRLVNFTTGETMRAVLAAILFLVTQGALAKDIPLFNPDFPTTLDQAKYDKLYPLSVKYCTMTALQRVGEKFGGPFAHAVLYFRNACVDTDYKYPQIRRCRPGENTDGVGVSVNKVYKNSNWVALPGRELFFYGDLKDSEPVTAANKSALMSKVEGMNIYQGIVLKDKVLYKQEGKSETAHKINQSLDTDFAINWGHSLYCVNIPLNEKLLNKGIEFVNIANMVHADGARFKDYKLQHVTEADLVATGKIDKKEKNSGVDLEYNWTGLNDNCAHLAFNMFAAMGLVAPKKVRSFVLPWRMAVPTDRWAYLISTANEDWMHAKDEAFQTWTDERRNSILAEHGVLLKHHGVVAEFIPAHSGANDLFKNQNFLANLNPVNFAKVYNYAAQRPEKIYDMEENLKGFEEEYTKILIDSENLVGDVLADPAYRMLLLSDKSRSSFAVSAARFRQAVAHALEQVKAKLELLKSER